MAGQLASISVSKNPPGLKLTWSNGSQTTISYNTLRLECPCAPCQIKRKGEKPSLRLPAYSPLPEEAFDLKEVTPIGQYAIALHWGDGHATGIYPYDYLRKLVDPKF